MGVERKHAAKPETENPTRKPTLLASECVILTAIVRKQAF